MGHQTSDAIKTATIAWTRVHAIIKSARALKSFLVATIGALTRRHVATRGALDLHQQQILLDRDRTVQSPEAHRTVQTIRGRTPRPRSDRTTIAARSSRNRGAYVVESPPVDQMATDGDPGSRSTHDRDPIMARLWPDRGKNCGLFEAKIEAN